MRAATSRSEPGVLDGPRARLETWSELDRISASRFASASAPRVDEVKDIRDKAVAVKEYARRAKDGQLVAMAAEIKLWAERRAGELLAEMAASRQRNTGGKPSSRDDGFKTLKTLGVTRDQSSAWQQLASIPEPRFREYLAGIDVSGLTVRKVLGALLADRAGSLMCPPACPTHRRGPSGAARGPVPSG